MRTLYGTPSTFTLRRDGIFYGADKEGVLFVHQTLGVIYLYELEGSIQQAIDKLKAEQDHAKDEIVMAARYIDDVKTKEVQFDDVSLTIETTYEDERTIIVVGERLADESEVKAILKLQEAKDADAENRRRKQYEDLKKEFSGK